MKRVLTQIEYHIYHVRNGKVMPGIHSNICGDISNIRGDVSHIRGDVSNISGDVSELVGDVSRLRGDISKICGEVFGIYGDVSGIRGFVTGIFGDATGIKGNVDEAELTTHERIHGININELIKPTKKSVTFELTDDQLEKVKKALDNF
jgi:hypothetical protein